MTETEDQKKFNAVIMSLAGDIVLIRDQLNDSRRRLAAAEDESERSIKRLDDTKMAIKILLEPFMTAHSNIMYLTHPNEIIRELAIEIVNDEKISDEDN